MTTSLQRNEMQGPRVKELFAKARAHTGLLPQSNNKTLYTYIHSYTSIHTSIHTQYYIRTYVHTCIEIYSCTHAYRDRPTRLHNFTCAHVPHTYVHKYTSAYFRYEHTYMHKYTYTGIHKHILIQVSLHIYIHMCILWGVVAW